MSGRVTLSVRLFGERNELVQLNSDSTETVERGIQTCLKDGLASFNISAEAIFLFGLRTQSGHWLRPSLKLSEIPALCAKENSGFGRVENIELRIRYVFPADRSDGTFPLSHSVRGRAAIRPRGGKVSVLSNAKRLVERGNPIGGGWRIFISRNGHRHSRHAQNQSGQEIGVR